MCVVCVCVFQASLYQTLIFVLPEIETIAKVEWDTFEHALHFELTDIVGRVGFAEYGDVAVSLNSSAGAVLLESPDGAYFERTL